MTLRFKISKIQSEENSIDSGIIGFEPCKQYDPPNRTLNFNQYFSESHYNFIKQTSIDLVQNKIDKIVSEMSEYVDEEGDWRRRHSKISF